MINAIKRIWVPKKLETQPAELAAEPSVAPASPEAGAPAPAAVAIPGPAPKVPARHNRRNVLFEELPKPEVVEKNSDSAWAAFESVHKPEIESK